MGRSLIEDQVNGAPFSPQSASARNLIALDYGRKRVGVAGCSSDVSVAFGITTLTIDSLRDLLIQLRPILESRQPSEILLGFPMTLNDTPGTLAGEILSLFGLLKDEGYTVHLVDEALSSSRAADLLRQRGKRARKEDHDRAAAAILLQEYLDGKLSPLSEVEISRIENNSIQRARRKPKDKANAT